MSKCLKCGGPTAVVDSRKLKTGDMHRRRDCLDEACGFWYWTLEIPAGPHPRCKEVAQWAAQNNRDIFMEEPTDGETDSVL